METTKIIKMLGFFALACFALVLLTGTPALAGMLDPENANLASKSAGGSSKTLGAVIKNLVKSTNGVPGIFTAFSYLAGIFFGFWGIMKMKDHVESPGNTPIWDPIKRFLAGGAFFAMPTIAGAAITSLAKGTKAADYKGFNNDGASSLGLDGMLAKLIGDIWMPMHSIIFGFCYLAGIILIIIGISRLLKSEQDGPRGPAGIGTIMTFLVAGALLSVDRMLGASMASMFKTNISSSNGVLKYQTGMDSTELAHAHTVIAAIIGFVAILGWISFVRGLFIIRGVSEGSSQASMMAAITHILGGAIAVNLGGFIMAVQNTLGITKLGVGITF